MESFITSQLLQNAAIGCFLVGILVALIGALTLVVTAGKTEGAGMAVLVFFLGIIGVPVLLYRQWQAARNPFFVWVGGIALLILGGILMSQVDNVRVQELYAQYEQEPNNPRVAADLGRALVLQRRYEEALPAILAAVEHRRKLPEVCDGKPLCENLSVTRKLPEVYNELGRPQEALDAWNRYVRPERYQSVFDTEEYAIALYGVGRKKEARRIFQEFCDSGPDYMCSKHKDKLQDSPQ